MNDSDYDEDEKKQYQDSYLDSMKKLTSGLDEDARTLVFEEMQTMSYNPSENPGMDAELNFMKAEKTLSSKAKNMGRGMSSFLNYKAKADSKTPAQVNRWAKKALREKD